MSKAPSETHGVLTSAGAGSTTDAAQLREESQVVIERRLDPGALRERLAEEALAGLLREPLRELPAKLLYDERGARLYERITTLPEYYPARCERAILNRRAPAIAAQTDASEIVELGAGSAEKTRALLYALAGRSRLRRYVGLDVSAEMLEQTTHALVTAFPDLRVHALIADYERDLAAIPPPEPSAPRLFTFLGGTIGNLELAARARLFGELRALMRPCDRLLVGIDLVKDPSVIERAYNDAAGVTAEFNRNVLLHVNRLLGCNFDPQAFDHRAFYEPQRSWIEMRLRARRDLQVTLGRERRQLKFAAGDEIRTETSAKFRLEAFADELGGTGLALEASWRDQQGLFALVLARPHDA